ncbi:hypothetical protein ACP0JK_29085 [Pseudomonas aeruginosa]
MTESKICTCPSGDGSLRWPCPEHPAVEQAGGDERAAFELFVRKHCGMPEHIAVNWDAKFTNDAWEGWQARAALAQPSPVSEALIYACKNLAQITSSDGSGHADIAMAVLRMAGVGDDERERVVNEWKAARAWKPSPGQAEAERPPQPERYTADVFHPERPYYMAQTSVVRASDFDEFATQYERIVGALRFERQQMDRAFTACINERDAALDRVAELEKQEPVAHLRASDLERLNQPGIAGSAGSLWNGPREGFVPLYAAPVAQAQHSVPEGWKLVPMDKGCVTSSMKAECIGEFSFYIRAACAECLDAGTDSDCHVCGGDIEYDQKIEVPWDTCKEIYKAMLAAAPGKEVGHE